MYAITPTLEGEIHLIVDYNHIDNNHIFKNDLLAVECIISKISKYIRKHLEKN